MPVVHPCVFLAVLAAILCPPAAPALGELASEFFPLTALEVRALPDATSGIVFPTEIPHDNAGPVLHILWVMADGEFLNQRKDVEVVGD